MRKRDQLDWRDAARERFAAAQKVPRCGDCRSLACTGLCRNLSSTRCATARSAGDPACPWWADADYREPLPATHAESQVGDRNYPRGMEVRSTWG